MVYWPHQINMNCIKTCLVFAALNILDRNVVKCFAVCLLLSFNWIVLLTCKLARVEPFSPPVRAFHELDTGVQRDGIYWHPNTEHSSSVYGVVGLVVVPGSFLLSP